MKIEVSQVRLEEILPLRFLFLQENNFQIRYNAVHERGRSDSYLIKVDNLLVGYGAVKGKDQPSERNTAFEFYLIPPFRFCQSIVFTRFLEVSSVAFIECQSNNALLTSLLYEFGQRIQSSAILFKDHITSSLFIEGATFRIRNEDDVIFQHTLEPVGDYVLEKNKTIVATGGFLSHYNPPFSDLYMEVVEDCRRQGLGSFLLQEIKKQCYLSGRVPAARCDLANTASKATLQKAGMTVAGFLLLGTVR